MIMGEQGKKANRIWFIHGGALFVFVGLAFLFFLLDGGTGEMQPIVVEKSAKWLRTRWRTTALKPTIKLR